MYRVRLGVLPQFLQRAKVEDYFVEVTEETKIELQCASWPRVVQMFSALIPEDHFLVAVYEIEEITS